MELDLTASIISLSSSKGAERTEYRKLLFSLDSMSFIDPS
jgi:hypothetical protein